VEGSPGSKQKASKIFWCQYEDIKASSDWALGSWTGR
jgi:hypothetical protein